MASSFLATVRQSRHSLRVAQTSVRYAGRKETGGVDPIKDVLRRTLYPPNIRSKASPTGTWRPDVARALQRAIPSRQAHETIERAWKLHERHLRKQREAELERKYECMRRAMDELQKIDNHLYKEANRQEDPRVRSQAEVEFAKTLRGPERRAMEARLRGLFPREIRVPTETPSREGWKHEWTFTIPSPP